MALMNDNNQIIRVETNGNIGAQSNTNFRKMVDEELSVILSS